jgi:hypothetical protein
MRERVLLDLVDEAARLRRWPESGSTSAGREVAALAADAGDVGGQRIQAAEVVEQPAVEAVGGERRLHRADVEPAAAAKGTSAQYIARFGERRDV